MSLTDPAGMPRLAGSPTAIRCPRFETGTRRLLFGAPSLPTRAGLHHRVLPIFGYTLSVPVAVREVRAAAPEHSFPKVEAADECYGP